MIKILITGPESSGKSTLTTQLSAYFKAPMVPEYARLYLKDMPTYQEYDLVQIALGQKKMEDDEVKNNPSILFCDTGMEVIEIWSQEKFGRIDSQITHLAQHANYDLVLLCKPNIEWQPDPLRENPTDRDRLFELYVDYLAVTNFQVSVIDESLNSRVSQAITVIKSFYPVLKSSGK